MATDPMEHAGLPPLVRAGLKISVNAIRGMFGELDLVLRLGYIRVEQI
jgi:hypothetical protein